jgi:hypothetical protein
MKLREKTVIIGAVYLAWQVIFSIVMSPLVLGVLTAEQMGYTLATVPMGIIVGVLILVIIAVVGRWTSAATWLFVPGLKYVKTREQFEQFWSMTLRGCDDGIIAETHWSGTVLPLLMIALTVIGIPFPLNVIPAIFFRWLLHVGAHLMFPRGESGERAFGEVAFFAKGLLISDIKNSLAFLISGNIIAPVMLHHLDSYVTTWTGNKERVAKSLGISLERV